MVSPVAVIPLEGSWTMVRKLLPLVLSLAVLGLWTDRTSAQEVTTGTIEGTVTDPQGGTLPGVTVTANSPPPPDSSKPCSLMYLVALL